MRLKCTGLFKKAHAAFDQGRGFEDLRGWGALSSSLVAFFKHTCYRHIHHILTFHTSGDPWPTAFYCIYHASLEDFRA